MLETFIHNRNLSIFPVSNLSANVYVSLVLFLSCEVCHIIGENENTRNGCLSALQIFGSLSKGL